MWILLGAVVSSSFVGSTHCVGMCGPLAVWAGGGESQRKASDVTRATGLYHLGRLVTYALVGAIAGGLGSLLELGGSALGVQLAAAKIVGVLLVLFGVLQFVKSMQMLGYLPVRAKGASVGTSFVAKLLVKLRPIIFELPLSIRGLLTGLLTALLPCGWLYLFALVAAGTGGVMEGSLVMAAFWLGSVPFLVALVAGTHSMSSHFRRVIPAAAALALIATGGYLCLGRGFEKLASLNDIVASSGAEVSQGESASQLGFGAVALDTSSSVACQEQLTDLTETKLPCCCTDK